MFTSFSSTKNKPVVKQEQGPKHTERLQLLTEAITTVLEENSHRIYIEESAYIVEFKLPTGFTLPALKDALTKKSILSSEGKVVGGEILVHTFSISGKSEPLEVLYKPFSTPRL